MILLSDDQGISHVQNAALFDVDGTLVNGHVWTGILAHPDINRWQVRRLYARTMPRLLWRRLYLLSETGFRDRWVRGLAGLLRGWTVQQVEALAAWVAADFLLSTYRPDAVALLRRHKEQGHRVILVSTMFTHVLAQIADYLGADAWLGTSLDIKDGRVSGRVNGVSCVGPRKLDFVRDYLAAHAPGVTLANCAAYADSFSDALLLGAVGRPVAVYPDDQLRQIAREQGWTIHPA